MSLTRFPDIKKTKKIKINVPKPFTPEAANAAWELAKTFKLPEIYGNPSFGETCAPWMKDLFMHIMGGCDYNDPKLTREVNTYFLLIPKKNGKSTFAAIVMLSMLILTPLTGIELKIISSSIGTAQNTFQTIRNAVLAFPEEARNQFKVTKSFNVSTIKYFANDNNLLVTTASDQALAGTKAPYIFIDELWEIGKRKNSASIIKEATGALQSYPMGFVMFATTQATDEPSGAFKIELEKARKIRDGKLKLTNYLPILYEFPDSMIKDESAILPKNFHLVNPSIGYTTTVDFILNAGKAAEADENEDAWRQFLAKHLNIEAGHFAKIINWSVAEYWKQNVRDYDWFEFMSKSDIITAGIDVGGRSDFFAVSLLSYCKEDDLFYTYARAWLTRDGYTKLLKKVPFVKELVSCGQLRLVDTYEDCQSASTDFLQEVMNHKGFYKVGYDPMDATRLLNQMKGKQMKTSKAFQVFHGHKLTPHLHRLDGLVGDRKLVHALEDKLLTWCVMNVQLTTRGNNVMIDKKHAFEAKIDSAISLVYALSLMPEQKPNQDKSLSYASS